jgi:hypothetical protein
MSRTMIAGFAPGDAEPPNGVPATSARQARDGKPCQDIALRRSMSSVERTVSGPHRRTLNDLMADDALLGRQGFADQLHGVCSFHGGSLVK